MNLSRLSCKKVRFQLLEDGVFPDSIVHVCEKRHLNIVGLLNREFTIEFVEDRINEFESDCHWKGEECEHVSLKEIPTDGKGRPHYKPYFPASFFQIAMVNHPLTNIFR